MFKCDYCGEETHDTDMVEVKDPYGKINKVCYDCKTFEKTCDRCGAKETEIIEKFSHRYGEYLCDCCEGDKYGRAI